MSTTNLKIESLVFDWDPVEISNNSISVEGIDVGWFPDGNWSFAAFSLADTKDASDSEAGNPLQVKIHLTKKGSFGYTYVKATSVLDESNTHLGFATRFPGKHALGDIPETKINFDNRGNSVKSGTENFVPLEFPAPNFHDLGVGVYDITWQWEWRDSPDDIWQPLRSTHHRIFVTLGEPQWPWTTWPSHKREPKSHLPTLPALLTACAWAAGANNTEEAASKIVNRLFDSGVGGETGEAGAVRYGSSTLYLKEYTNMESISSDPQPEEFSTSYFLFNEALARLLGGFGLGETMNCQDCAHMVVALTNVIGGNLAVGYLCNVEDLNQGKDDDNRFSLNPMCAIGYTSWEDTRDNSSITRNGDKSFFSFHAIGWTVADMDEIPDSKDFESTDIQIFDACVQLGADYPYTQVNGMKFGSCDTAGTYRTSLATSDEDGCVRAKPQPVLVKKTVIL